MIWKIDGYLAIPHELLHVLAYRLIGKKCRYQIGQPFVEALEPRTFRQRIFVLLFPLFITGGAGLIFILLWAATYLLIGYPPEPINYFHAAPVWHQSLLLISFILMLYSGSSLLDIVMTVQLLLQKLRQQPPHYAYKQEDERYSPQNPN